MLQKRFFNRYKEMFYALEKKNKAREKKRLNIIMVNDESGLHLGQFNIVKNLDVKFFYCVKQSTDSRMLNIQHSHFVQEFYFFFWICHNILALNQQNNRMRLWMDYQFFNDHVQSPLKTIDLIFGFIDKSVLCLFYEYSVVRSFKNPSKLSEFWAFDPNQNANKTETNIFFINTFYEAIGKRWSI